MEPRTVAFTPAGDLIRWIEIPGHGDPVVYVHGLGCHGAATWAASAVRMGRRAIIMDLPGHGRSDRPESFAYSLADLAGSVARVIEAVSDRPLDVVSHSLGGSAAIVLAARHPELVSRSVLVEPGIDVHPVRPGDLGAWTDEQVVDGGWDELLAAEVPWRRADVRLADPLAIVRSARHISAGLGGGLPGLIAGSSVPTTLVRSPLRTYATAPEFESTLARQVVIPDAGHFVMLDQPKAFDDALRAALA